MDEHALLDALTVDKDDKAAVGGEPAAHEIPLHVKIELGKNKVAPLSSGELSFRSADNARKPYTANGRTLDVWKVLLAFGITRDADGRPTPSPNPCFELWARHPRIKGSSPEEIADMAAKCVQAVRAAPVERLGCDAGDPEVAGTMQMSDAQLLLSIASSECVVEEAAPDRLWYFSFCLFKPVQASTHWHCKICKNCRDWMTWHCANCNKCTYGQGIPCPNCMPVSYERYREGYA